MLLYIPAAVQCTAVPVDAPGRWRHAQHPPPQLAHDHLEYPAVRFSPPKGGGANMHRVGRRGIHHLRGVRGEGVPQGRTNWRKGMGARRTGTQGGDCHT